MRWRIILVALLPILLPAATAFAQQNTIRGKVRATSGATLNNAVVELRMGGGGLLGQTVTRNDGDFSFNGLVSAEYEISVMLAGYEPAVQFTRFNNSPRDGVREDIFVEVIIKAKPGPALGAPGVSFAQDVPQAARAAYEKATARLQEGKPEEAIALLREATGIFNDYFDAYFVLGTELLRRDRDDEALEALEQARRINEREGAVYHVFGLVMMKQKKFAVAEYAFREATRLNRSNASSHFYRGVALVELVTRSEDERQRKLDMEEAEKELNLA
ncbi:MAG TPA: carboxypeptidase regulatory-like domain-containing protein, partial [Blastocatellia bacterium]|nr:carboxypeptidase regulatory-like domain-containing protein [Blastocatellia bacterium]